MDRRRLLKMFGLAPAVAVTSGADLFSAVGLQSPLGTLRDNAMGSLHLINSDSPPTADINNNGNTAYQAYRLWKATSNKIIPDHVMEYMIEEAKNVYALDPDLASNKSYSISAKMYFQRQRNIERRNTSSIFENLFGFNMY